jgi:hypothetical protein
MKMALTVTLDGLIRALRWKAHRLAEDIEDGSDDGEVAVNDAAGRTMRMRRRTDPEARDDQPGR